MVLFILAYLGGVLTILSPCILPVLPFVFARADRSFVKGGLPMLTGMALAFVVLASLSVAGGWAVTANQYARLAAIYFSAFLASRFCSRLWLIALHSRWFPSAHGCRNPAMPCSRVFSPRRCLVWRQGSSGLGNGSDGHWGWRCSVLSQPLRSASIPAS